jgi:23S rRNA pseudouridine1911/1915/1917 synthase
MKKRLRAQYIVELESKSVRLDVFMSGQLPDYSRSQIQNWIRSGFVQVDAVVCLKPRAQLSDGQSILLDVEIDSHSAAEPEKIALDILFEDDDLVILNKPAGLVVHPGAGNARGTMMNALLHHHPPLSLLPRAGIVHRLDKDTTGVMMVAKTPAAFQNLTQALSERRVKRQYLAIADGEIKQSQVIDQPIARHPVYRQKMAIQHHGKPAISHISLLQRLTRYTLVSVTLETGRTHQIRVHLQSIGHPILGDSTYGRHRGYHRLTAAVASDVLAFKRQALHAQTLCFIHPITDRPCEFTASIPADFQHLISILQPENERP